MARRKAHAPLNVLLNARLVGRLSRHASGAIDFAYEPQWLAFANAIPVSLSMPLREERYAGAPVIAVFDNLLPDGKALRRRVAERVGAEGDDAYSLLSKIGRDCVGALQFLPDGQEPDAAGAVKGKIISDALIANTLANLARAPLGMSEDNEFRISLAGAQEKTALLRWNKKWRLPLGSTPTTHIVKPQIGKLANGVDMTMSVENEYLCMKLAAAFSVPTAAVSIADFDGERALVVERFDRHLTNDDRLLRIPQEDFCQALSTPPTLKYQSDGGPGASAILELLKASDEPEADRLIFLKAQILFWLLGATDGHAKNFSIFLKPGGGFRLTPLYDILSAQPAVDAGQISHNKFKLAMSVGDSRHYGVERISLRHFVETAISNGLPASAVNTICDDLLSRSGEATDGVIENLPADFPEGVLESIVGGVKRRAKSLEAALN
ncbi:MAG: type II toxin-antitoxin system HipA family toxin [Pseudomonadota bacterium]